MFNGIWRSRQGLQVSGIHYFGAGIRASTNYGGDLRNVGQRRVARLRAERHDRRAQQLPPAESRTRPTSACSSAFRWAAGTSIDLIAEVFNAFNMENFALVTQESASNFRLPYDRSEPNGAARVPADVLVRSW